MDRRADVSRRMVCSLGIAAALLVLSSGVAEAFWPFTREAKASPDSISEQRWQKRFEAWKAAGPLQQATGDSSAARESAAAGATVGSDAPDTPTTANRSMQDLIRQAQEKTRSDTLAAEAPATSAEDSLQASDSGGATTGAAPTGTEATDTAAAAAAAAQAAQDAAKRQAMAAAGADGGFRPKFSSALVSGNDKMNFNSSLNASFNDPSGVLLSAGLNYSDDYNLNQGSNTRSRGLVSSFSLPVPDYGMNFSLRTSNNQREILGARTGTNERSTTVTDSKNAGLTAGIGRQLVRGVGANASYSVDFRYGNQDITATGSSSGDRENKTRGQSYGIGMNFNRLQWLQVQGRVGRALTNNTDITSSFITEDNPLGEEDTSSRGDSVTATISMPLGEILPLVSANYRLTKGRRSFTDPARTGSGAAAGGGTFILETEQRYQQSLQMRGTIVPLRALKVDATYEVSRDSVAYAVKTNSYNDTKTHRWGLSGELQYHENGVLKVNYDYSKADVDRDEVGRAPNPQTRNDRENRLTADLTQTWIGTLKTRMYAELRLNQGFYIHEGPQGLGDRDDFRTQLGLDINGAINSRMKAGIQSYVRTFDQYFIDPRRSFNSREETEYVVIMDFNYQVTPAFKLQQRYGLSSTVLIEIHNENRDTLSRNHYLRTNWDYRFNPRLSFSGSFNYILQDNGAYLDDPNTASLERFYSPTQQNTKNEAKVDVRYAVLPGGKLTITSSQQVAQDRRTSFDRGIARGVNTTRRSTLALGVDSTIKLGDLQLKSRASRNQNLNSTLNRDVYYNIDATLTYDF